MISLTRTTVRRHPRKGTSGVRRHSRNTTNKKTVPHQPYRDEIVFTREASLPDMVERTDKILFHITPEDIKTGRIRKRHIKIRPDDDQLRREYGIYPPPQSVLEKRDLYEYSFHHNLNEYTCRLEKDKYPLCTRRKKGKETIIRDNTFIKRLKEHKGLK